jgi:cobalt-zinc-cadmium efflux system outer membrane protein
MEDDINDFDQVEKEITALFRSTADLEPDASITTEEPVLTFPPAETLNELYEMALQKRPELAGKNNEIEQRRLEIKLAQRLRFPDITVWTGYRYREDIGGMPGEDLVSFGFSLPLNFDLSKNLKAKYNFSKYMLSQAQQDLREKELALKQDLEIALAEWERADQKVTFYEETIIPEAESVLKLALSSYETSGSEFGAVYQAQKQLIEFEKIYIHSRYDKMITEVRIQMLTGY